MPAPTSSGPRELSLRDGLARAPRGYGGAEALSVECNACGATVRLAAEERATRCTYCASPMVVTKPPNPELIQPESLLPLAISQPRATSKFDDWLRGLWFRPSNLAEMARVEGVHGIYLPYWTFDAEVDSEWKGERGEYYYTTERYTEVEADGREVSKTREVRQTRWRSARGRRSDRFDDVLVCASRGVREDLASQLCTFDTKKLVPYSPGYLCGWRAEAYAFDLPAAWEKGKAVIEQTQAERCKGDVGGDEQRIEEVRNTFRRETFKHVLLPLFVLAYRYRDRPYQVLVNGQTGEVVGKAPLSLWKVMLVVIPINVLILGVSVMLLPLLLVTVPAVMIEIYIFYKNYDEWFA